MAIGSLLYTVVTRHTTICPFSSMKLKRLHVFITCPEYKTEVSELSKPYIPTIFGIRTLLLDYT